MQRSPSVVSQYNDDLSSPDPLATSVSDGNTTSSISPGKRKPAVRRPSIPISKTIARHTKSSSQSIEIFPSSPFRAVSEQNISPWKIRVTVEAEPEDPEMDGNAPMTRARTRTTTIPLPADSSSTGHVMGFARGREAKSPSRDNKRSATSTRGSRNSSRSRRQSVTDLNIIPLGDDAEEDDWLKQKRSPQKKRSPRKSTAAPCRTKSKQSSPSVSRSTSNAADFEIRQDTDAEAEEAAGEPVPALDSDSPELKKLDLNQISVRPRATSTKHKDNVVCSKHEPIMVAKKTTPLYQGQLQARTVSANSAMSYPTPSPTSSYHGDSDDVDKRLDDDAAEQAADEGFDTVHESEGFTMIDLETLPSVKRLLSSPLEEGNATSPRLPKVDDLTEPGSSMEMKGENMGAPATSSALPQQTVTYPILRMDESEFSSTIPSSPPVLEKHANLLNVSSSSRPDPIRKVTPVPYSSPKLPSPPRHQLRRTPQHQHRASAGTLFAGIALQEIISPVPNGDKEISGDKLSTSKPPEERTGDILFKGYDSGTQRELRAGLRFGEELAKRQLPGYPMQPNASENTMHLAPKADKSSSRADAQPRASGAEMQNAKVTRARLNRCESPRIRDEDRAVGNSPQTPQDKDFEPSQQYVPDTQARREHEWHLERQVISRQIQSASESQVIVLDSDSEDEREEEPQAESEAVVGDETDIWLAEANSSSSPHQVNTDDPFTRSERQQRERAQEAISRPRRSLIPSPWKRGENVGAPEQTTLLSNQEGMSGLMAYNEPASKLRFGAGQIKRQQLKQRLNSGKFDIDLMAGTPKRQIEEDSIDVSGGSAAEFEKKETDQALSESDISLDIEEHSVSINGNQRTDGESVNETSDFSDVSASPIVPVKIPVNFNDSSISISTPPARHQHLQQRQPPNESFSESPPRPPTPRSAMKGSCVPSAAAPLRLDDPTIRRVIFSGRSRGMDVDGHEDSFSMRSSSDGSIVDEVGLQLKQELRAMETRPVKVHAIQPEVKRVDESLQTAADVPETTPRCEVPSATAPPGKGWTSWIWGSNRTSVDDSQSRTRPDANSYRASSKATMASPASHDAQQSQPQHERRDWQPTKSSIPSAANNLSNDTTASNTHPVDLPSYLLPPSYPSDPLRSTTTPLALSGVFSNTHFRTLHIIYRKSLRPKFHPPTRDQIRQEVWDLRGKEMVVDESQNGGGEFVWTVGDAEVEVLERFMQEVEVSNGWFAGRRVRDGRALGKDKCVWGWTVGELASWLCRIVVGEVVREEEQKVRKRERELAQMAAT